MEKGHSEQIVARSIKGYDRSKLTLITKLWKDWMPKDLVETACDQSLKDLDTDYIDVYFIHYPSDTGVPIADTMEAMMKLKEKGKIRCIGVSNFSKGPAHRSLQIRADRRDPALLRAWCGVFWIWKKWTIASKIRSA